MEKEYYKTEGDELVMLMDGLRVRNIDNIKVNRTSPISWTKEQEEWLFEYYTVLTLPELEHILGLSRKTIHKKIIQSGYPWDDDTRYIGLERSYCRKVCVGEITIPRRKPKPKPEPIPEPKPKPHFKPKPISVRKAEYESMTLEEKLNRFKPRKNDDVNRQWNGFKEGKCIDKCWLRKNNLCEDSKGVCRWELRELES